MPWVKNTNRKTLPEGTRVQWRGVEGRVEAPAFNNPPNFIRVNGLGPNGYVNLIHYMNLEVWRDDPPPVPAQQYRETNYYQDVSTGTLYYLKGDTAIAVGSVVVPVPATDILAHPSRYKRLFREE